MVPLLSAIFSNCMLLRILYTQVGLRSTVRD